MWIRVVLALAIAAVAVLMFWPDGELRPGAAAGERTTAAAPAVARAAAPDPGPRRDVVEPVAEDPFVSEAEDGGIQSGAVRDGVVILVLGPDR
jgi:hypothetical protein